MISRFNLLSLMRNTTRFVVGSLMVLFLILAAVDGQAQTAERRIHTVEAGQTLYSISRIYDVSVDDIRRWNNLRGNQINVGQRLIVSSGQTEHPRTTPVIEVQGRDTLQVRHQVRGGETLFSISRRYGVTVSDIREWNRLQSNLIEVGQVLIIREAVQDVTERPVAVAEDRRDTERSQAAIDDAAAAAAATEATSTTATTAAAAATEATSTVAATAAATTTATETAVATQAATTAAAATVSITTDSASVETIEQVTEVTPPVTDFVDEGEAIRSGPVASAYYTVRTGDTVSEIARRHGITSAELLELNRLRSDRLAVGQVLLVRRPQGLPSVTELRAGSTPQGRFASYEVRRGERLNEVLRQFQMTEPELAALNPDIDITSLAQGQGLTVLLPPDIIYTNPYRVYTESTSEPDENTETETIQVIRYGNNDRGRSTTSGDLYNPEAFTAAHNRLPLGTILFVQNPDNQSGIFVLVNDRMVEQGLRLSHTAFDTLGFEPSRANNAVITITER
jgi:LysM repeat protein